MAALTASLSEQKEATEKAAEQLEAKLRVAEAAREHLKTEFTEVRGQLDAARADTEAQKQAAVVAREEAEQHAATLADFKEAADRAAEQHRAKLRETEITCDQLKTELAEVRDQLDAARANAEAQKQASVAASNEAERQMAALTASEKRVREQKEAAEKAAEQQEAKLRGVETARDQLMTELAEIRGQLDAARADVEGEKQAAAAASEEAERRRAALAASEKTLREQKEAAEKAVEQYRRQVEQQGMVLRDAEATRDEMRSESEKLASKLQARFDEIAKLTKLLQAAESVSVARTKELTETQGVQKRLSAEAEARRKQLAEELSKAKAALREQKEAADKVAEQYRQRVEQQGTVLRELESTRDKLKAESHGLASKLQARFDEIAKLTSLLQAVESASVAKTKELAETREVQQRLSAEAEALRKKLAEETIKAKSARQASINQLGKPLKRSELAQFAAKIKEAGVLDSGWYLKKYKDVADAGMDPAVHYLLYGINEGREPSAPSRGASKG
jgi:chromosome segregation ATPase